MKSFKLALVSGLVGLGGLGYAGMHLHAQRVLPAVVPQVAAAKQAAKPTIIAAAPFSLPKSQPVRLHIPAIGVDAPFITLGLKADNTLQTPTNGTDVGWYSNSPTPGEIGPSIVTAHVDTYKDGPAVFWNLHQLKAGDGIQIIRADGTTATFVVDKTVQYPQDAFPTSEVYGNTTDAELRLITCGGVFSTDTHHYNLNTVVYATLAPAK